MASMNSFYPKFKDVPVFSNGALNADHPETI